MSIVSKPPTEEYRDNWELIYGAKNAPDHRAAGEPFALTSDVIPDKREDALRLVRFVLFDWVDKELIEETDRLDEDLDLDEPDLHEVLGQLECDAGLWFESDATTKLKTVADIVNFIVNYVPQ